MGCAFLWLPNTVAPYGSWGLMAWGVMGAFFLIVIGVFSRLCVLSPNEEGPSFFIWRAFHQRRWRFLIEWSLMLCCSCTVVSLAKVFFFSLGAHATVAWKAGFLGALLFVCTRKEEKTEAFRSFLLQFLISVVFVFCLSQIPFIKNPFVLKSAVQDASFLEFCANILYGFGGFEWSTMLLSRRNRRNARVFFLGSLAMFAGRTVMLVSMMGTLSVEKAADERTLAFVSSAQNVLGAVGGVAMTVCVLGVAFLCSVDCLLCAHDLLKTSAHHKSFFSIFTRVNKNGVAFWSMLIVWAFVAGVVALEEWLPGERGALVLSWAENMQNASFVAMLFGGCVAFLKLTWNEHKVGARWGNRILGAVAFGVCLFFTCALGPQGWEALLGLLLTGTACYEAERLHLRLMQKQPPLGTHRH